MKSRYITQMVNNDYIVCLGYTNIFNRILKEMGINASVLELSQKSGDKVVDHLQDIIKGKKMVIIKLTL